MIFRKGLQSWAAFLKNIWRLHLGRKYAWIFVLGHYFFLEFRSFPRAKTVRISEQIMSADNYPGICSRQIETVFFYIYNCPSAYKNSRFSICQSLNACNLLICNKLFSYLCHREHRWDVFKTCRKVSFYQTNNIWSNLN